MQHITVLNTVGNCDRMVSIIILYYNIQGGREVTVPRPIRYHNLIWITYVHLVTCPVDPYVHLDAGHKHTSLTHPHSLSLCCLLRTHTVCPCAVSYAPTQSVPIAASYSAMLETWLIPQLRDRGLLDDVWLQHDVHSHTSLFLCAMFSTNIFQAAGLAVAHRHLQHHFHGHHVVLTLPHQTIRSGVLSSEEWLRVTTTTTKICAELCKTPFAQLPQKCSDVCHRGHACANICVQRPGAHTDSLDM